MFKNVKLAKTAIKRTVNSKFTHMNKFLVKKGQRYGKCIEQHYGPKSLCNAMAQQLLAQRTFAPVLRPSPEDVYISSQFYLEGILFAHFWAKCVSKCYTSITKQPTICF